MSEELRTGACLCGAVRFNIRGNVRGVIYCHCSQCRRQSGHYFAATNVRDEQIEITGEESITWYSASSFAKRGFCTTCGSALFWRAKGEASLAVLAGAFDEPSGLVEQSHIFTGDKGDYYEISDGLPQFDTSPSDLLVDKNS